MKNPWIVTVVVAMSAFMEILDVSIANVALQHIAGDMSASQEQATWILTSYLVTNAIILPLAGWFSGVFGRKRFFIVCIIGFSICSLFCGLSLSLPMLIFFRALQGLTGGGLQPSSQAILADAFPPEKRGMAFAVYGMSVVFAPAIGPTLGGWITDNFSWQWIFLINVPVGMILVPLVMWLVHDTPESVTRRETLRKNGFSIDYLGFAFLSLGLGCLQVMLDKGSQEDWFASPLIVVLGIIAVLGLVSFVLWELGQEHPIVDVNLFKIKNFAACNFMNFMLGFMVFGTTALLPQLVQNLFGYNATTAGMVLSPGGFTLILVMPIIGKLVGKVDARYLVAFGLTVDSFALFLMGHFSPSTSYETFVLYRVIQTIGMGFLFIPLMALLYVDLPSDKNDQASSISSLARNLGGSVGISLIMNMLTRDTQTRQTELINHVTADNGFYRQTVDGFTRALSNHGGSEAQILAKAQTMITRTVESQAALLSYSDVHYAFATLIFIIIPLVFLTKRQPTDGTAPTHLAE